MNEHDVVHTLGGVLSREHVPASPFYITTPIYYVNDRPHIGHAYTTIACDVMARYWRMRGREVVYVTGTDENAQKNYEAAERVGKDLGLYLDEMSALWQRTWDSLDISNTDFIRTTEARHRAGVEKFWKTVEERGDIYKGVYEGWYCVGCEAFLLEADVVDGACPIHQRQVERISEENYFFRLSKYREALLEYLTMHPEFVQPESRKHEIINYIQNHMEDVSISRHRARVGIEVPGDAEHKIYVWFDALINYLTAVGYSTDDAKFSRVWPASVHVVGKDIIKFHCALWPAMLMSAGLPQPERVVAHGFFTIDGKKMSKSLGNVVDPVALSQELGIDALRYFLLREITFGEDGDFSTTRLRERYQSDLANELGNLCHRVLSMTEKYCDGVVPTPPPEHDEVPWAEYAVHIEAMRFGRALDCVWEVVRAANKFIEDEKPWTFAADDRERTNRLMGHLCETLRQIAWMLVPMMPHVAEDMMKQLGLSADAELQRPFDEAIVWGEVIGGVDVAKGAPLFPRVLAH